LSIISVRKKPPATPVARRQDGKKHHVLVDTQALPRPAIVHAAAIQDRDGGVPPMRTLFGLAPFLRKRPAVGGSKGGRFQPGLKRARRRVNGAIVTRSDAA